MDDDTAEPGHDIINSPGDEADCMVRRIIATGPFDGGPPSPNVYPPDQRTQIATAALSGILARVDGKLPIQTGDIDRFVAGAASLAVKAADALIKELNQPRGTP